MAWTAWTVHELIAQIVVTVTIVSIVVGVIYRASQED